MQLQCMYIFSNWKFVWSTPNFLSILLEEKFEAALIEEQDIVPVVEEKDN